ncbi:hypothetical protein HYC85_011475 [Camellia sinensis]|uniref:C3H1-type domain-containing protein n=1 Tax=Camellia sinensis TaxID=4442 RepID=A0A7J7H954_CAMSI|nr:hypothetical protein HYC85_011475 [Camellia sinensis]
MINKRAIRFEMDPFEALSIVFSRIRKLEPENVSKKIIGYILVQDGSHEMIRLAFGPDNLIQNLIHIIKIQLGLVPKPVVSPPISPSMNLDPFTPFSPFSSRVTLRVPTPYWDPQVNPEHQTMHDPHFIPVGYSDSVPEDFRLQNRAQIIGLEDRLEPVNSGIPAFSSDYYYPEVRSQRSPTLSDFPIKACHYFNKGFCKHGSNCRYFHGQPFPESFSPMFSPGSNEIANDDHMFLPGSLEKLELEITELLKLGRGSPISIASLPMLYFETYGRTLQAEGYLTESQRHGKVGYSLTKLIARLKSSVRLIDRPHGQHSVILAEDAPKYMENRGERNDPGPIVSGSRQIYLTFPAESTFTEEDVANYFDTFGPVQDVRIPCQQKRMFGFVTFANADTVKMILLKGNPHYVCGARVLVKPYREKSKLFDRKYLEKMEPLMHYGSHFTDMDSDLHSRWESSRMLRKQFMEEPENALEIQTWRLSEMHFAQKTPTNNSYFGYSMDEVKASEDHSKFPSAESFTYLLDALNSRPTSDDNPKHAGINHGDQESGQGLNLPESPFASPIASNISTVT